MYIEEYGSSLMLVLRGVGIIINFRTENIFSNIIMTLIDEMMSITVAGAGTTTQIIQ